jgi:hypothetical protein
LVVFDIAEEPVGRCYAALVLCSLEYCDRFLLVVRDARDIDQTCVEVLEKLAPHLLTSQERKSWPGTELMDGAATVNEYALTADSSSTVTALAHSLYQWVHPSRPEDLCLLRPSGEAWLTSIAHERDSYLALREAEEMAVRSGAPALSLKRSRGYQ